MRLPRFIKVWIYAKTFESPFENLFCSGRGSGQAAFVCCGDVSLIALGLAWLKQWTDCKPDRVFDALSRDVDISVSVGDFVDFTFASMAVTTRLAALASDVRFVYFFLCGVACDGLVLVGSRVGAQRDAGGCVEKTFHYGGNGGFSDYELACLDFHQRLDEKTGASMATAPQVNLSDSCFVHPALLVA